jgi:hypothetical protein
VRQLRLQIAEFRPRRHPPVPEQETDLLEGGLPREIVDVVPAVRENAQVSIQVADGRRRGDDVFEPCLRLLDSGHRL